MKRDLIIYAGVIVLGQGLALLVSPFTTRLLSEQQFAALPLLASIYGVVAIIQHAGIDLAFPFFLANAAEKSSRQKIFVTSTLVASVAAVVVWGILTLGASVHSWLREYAGVTRLEILLYLAGLLATMLVNWQIGIMRFHHMVMAYARVALLGTTVATLVAVPLIALVEPAYRLAVVIGIQATMQYAALAWSLREFRRAGARVYARQAFSFDLARRMLRFGIALLPGSVVYGFLVMTDRYLVRWMAPDQVHVLVLAAALGSVVFMVRGVISLMWAPYVVEWITTRRPDRYVPRLDAGLALFGGAGFLLASLAAVWADWAVHVLYPAQYQAAASLVPILVLAGAVSVLSLVAAATALIANTPHLHFPVHLVALGIHVAICLLLVPAHGAVGAALGFLGAQGFIILAWGVLGRRILRNLRLRWGLPAAMAAAAGGLVAFYRPGGLWPAQVLVERVLVSAGAAAAILILLWRARPTGGWRKAFA